MALPVHLIVVSLAAFNRDPAGRTSPAWRADLLIYGAAAAGGWY